MKYILILFFLLGTINCWAQETNSSSDTRLDPVYFDGRVTGVPDGTPITLQTYVYDKYISKMEDTIRNGSFHFAKLPTKKNEHYSIYLPCFYMNNGDIKTYCSSHCEIYASPGTRTKITGEGMLPYYWLAENDNFDQKEYIEYRKFVKDNLDDYYELLLKVDAFDRIIGDKSFPLEQREEAHKTYRRLWHEIELIRTEEYNKPLLAYFQNRPYSLVMLSELCGMSHDISDEPDLRSKGLQLFTRIPEDDQNCRWAQTAKNYLYSADKINVGDTIPDYIYYDLEDKEHHINEFKGKYCILNFSFWGCVGCHVIKPHLEWLSEKYKKQIEIVTISTDDVETWKEKTQPSVLHDWNDHKSGGEMISAFDITLMPFFVIVDPERKVANICIGSRDFLNVFLKYFPDCESELNERLAMIK